MLDDEMLTIDDVARYLKLKPQTIYKWAQTGKIPGAKFGKEWRFRRSQIEAWIDSHMPAKNPDSESGGKKSGRRSGVDGAEGEDAAAPPKRRSARVPPSRAKPDSEGPTRN